MSPLAIRRLLRQFGARGIVLLVVIVLSGAIAMHHSLVSAGDMHPHAGVTAAVELCLAVMAAGAAALAIAIGVARLARCRPTDAQTATGVVVAPRAPVVRTRAGPGLISLLCVSRR